MQIFPAKNAGYNAYVEIAAPYVAANAVRLKIPGAAITELNTLFSDWAPTYIAAFSKETRTHVTIENRNDLRALLTKKLSEIYKDIPQSALTTEDRATLRLKARDRVRTRAHIMSTAPSHSISVKGHNRHQLYLSAEGTTSKQIPSGQFVLMLYFVGEARLKDGDIVFNHVKIITRHVSVIHHQEELAGKTAYYKCCYVNRRGECGPWSEVKRAIVA
ncbi:MAG TPA: hypothetical protein VI757_11515 [Bacteroidia bacterium]|nr:hypothetical protein [Bacteroidia bacterium]